MEKKVDTLPEGYNFRTSIYGDSEGVVMSVSLVASAYKVGSWQDRWFGRKILTYAGETSLEATESEIELMISDLKRQLSGHFFSNREI